MLTKTGPLKVFVYGTLKPGESNYRRYCEGKVADACPAIAIGELFALPAGYPAMTEGVGNVYGFMLTFSNNAILAALDRLEDYNPQHSPAKNLYQRQEIELFDRDRQSLGTAWAYLMLRDRVQSLGGIPLPEGYWHRYS
ncbi:MAG TPA: gamma-glutamylcyclotransferase [Kamptonema sp.]|nr:gamma-glutamylcyclotransferase [Kamptonema sp.]